MRVDKIKQHPLQNIAFDEKGVIRFEKNAIVEFLLDHGGFDLNALACKGFSEKDWSQFAQLIGYSVSGWGGLSYVTEKQCEKADKKADKLAEKVKKLNKTS